MAAFLAYVRSNEQGSYVCAGLLARQRMPHVTQLIIQGAFMFSFKPS
jgi:hypothetical protein